MTNISKQNTNAKDYEIAFKELTAFIETLRGHEVDYFLTELLTEAETIMIVKRFAAIIMIHKNYSTYRISHTLSISLSTCQRLFDNYEQGLYSKLISCIKEKEVNRFLLLIEDLIMFKASGRSRSRLLKRVL